MWTIVRFLLKESAAVTTAYLDYFASYDLSFPEHFFDPWLRHFHSCLGRQSQNLVLDLLSGLTLRVDAQPPCSCDKCIRFFVFCLRQEACAANWAALQSAKLGSRCAEIAVPTSVFVAQGIIPSISQRLLGFVPQMGLAPYT